MRSGDRPTARPDSGARSLPIDPRIVPVESSPVVLTLLGARIDRVHLGLARAVLSGFGLRVERLAALSGGPRAVAKEPGFPADRAPCRALEVAVAGPHPNIGALRRSLRSSLEGSRVDSFVQREDGRRHMRRLVCLDMDSTLVDAEGIDELARAAGSEREVAAITDAAMRGEIEFRGAFRARLGRVAGLPVEALEAIAGRLPLAPGAGRLLAALDRHGFRVAVVSGGFAWLARRLAERFGLRFDHVHAHELVIRDGRLTGEIEGEVIDGAAKAAFVREAAAREGLTLEEVVAVGDGANDLDMLRAAGLGIAFRPRPVLRAGADHVIENFGLDGILYLLGMDDRDIDGK